MKVLGWGGRGYSTDRTPTSVGRSSDRTLFETGIVLNIEKLD
ncbi:hypothetical protein [Methylotuvimicrobium alcaliphilum]